MAARRIALGLAFLGVHILIAWQGWSYPNQPMGDVSLVYQPWAVSALSGGEVVGVNETWVYPPLALVPLLVAQGSSLLIAPLVGASSYLIAWAALITVLDTLALLILLRERNSVGAEWAGWFWVVSLLALGPIAMYRLDGVTLPLAVAGGVLLMRRPGVAGAILTAAAWIKVWPGAVFLAGVIALKNRIRLLGAALVVSVVVVAANLLMGGAGFLFGFLTEQGNRGLQIESIAATPLMWLVPVGAAAIDYSLELLTYEVSHPAAGILSAILSPLMVVVVAVIAAIGVMTMRGRRELPALVPPLALALLAALIVTNKVGSPQFQVWLIAPIMLWLLHDGKKALPATIIAVLSFVLTCLIYPLMYGELLAGQGTPIVVLTVRNALVIVLLWLAIRGMLRTSSPDSATSHARAK